ncbi:transcription factor of the MADS box [Saitozyma podzolica]|uniref:Transcription factor of the MADS box n=1 Tax=Saitozyma podzolica TaxID=1890683 RepID=A0A427YI45_9TREE|nr:transcription factor of the MADS box [Saitozyma podzolica]
MDAMNEFTHHTPDGDAGAVDLNMDGLHDFGEGVGVDMRDFTSHADDETKEGMNDPLSHLNAQSMPQPSGSTGHPAGTAVKLDDMFQAETGLDDDDDDDDEGEPGDGTTKRPRHNDVPGGFTYVDKDGESGRRKIRIEYIGDKSRRHITFSKRKAGIMKKAYELSILTGTQVLLLVVSETGLVYTFTTTKLQPLVQKAEGKNLIQACLNAPDGYGPDGQPLTGPVPATKAKNGGLAIRPHKLTAAASAAMAASAQAAHAQSGAAPVDPHGHGQSDINAQQAEAAAAVGQGTPVSARPKKRLPSGKRKGGAAAQPDVPSQPEVIPPVPSIPDMHRQASPHMMNHLASPLSAGYHIPPEYQHHQAHAAAVAAHAQPSPTNPAFGYPQGDQYGYYANPQQMGGQYLGMPPQGQQMAAYQQDRERARMMMAGDQQRMGMQM